MTRSGGTKGHFGTDITSPKGTNLVAMEAGEVIEVKTTKVGGLQVYVRMSDGSVYKYFHLSAVSNGISKGVNVQEGQVIAASGNSGNASSYAGTNEEHVHVTVLDANGANVNPVEWLNDPNADVPVDVLTTTGTPPQTPITVPAASPNQQTITDPNGSVTIQQQPLPPGQPHKHKPPKK
jgi:murein DD-endopeptidase MepM/ murein hydrolase activator NlpD